MGTDNKTQSRFDRRTFLNWGAITGSAALAGCAGSGDNNGDTTDTGENENNGETTSGSNGGDGSEKSVFRFASPAEQASLDAANANLSYGWEWTYLHYNSLLKLAYNWEEEQIETVPDLAESYEWIEDTVVQFEIRDDVTFHNGDQLTGELVKRELDHNLNNTTTIGGQVYYQLGVDEITLDGDSTVNVHFTDTIAPSYFDLLWPRVMLANPNVREERGQGNFASNPGGGGTGPYEFNSYTSGSEIVLERYEDYHEDDVPAFERAVCKIIPEGSTRMAQLRSGSLDLDNFVSATNWTSLEDNDDVTKRQDVSTMTIGIVGNLESDNVPDAYGDPRVRRALQQAINRESFADAVFDGESNAVSIPTLPGSWWDFPEHQEKNLFDLENARSLMADAGYSDGFEVQLNVGSDSWHQTMGQVVKSMWNELNVTVNLNPMESTTLWARISQGEQPLSISEHLAPPDPDWFLRAYLVPPESAPDQVTTGLNGWEHEEYFSVAREARVTRDRDKRRELYRELNELYAEQMPMIWFSNGYNLAVHQNELKDYWQYPGAYSREANRYVSWQG